MASPVGEELGAVPGPVLLVALLACLPFVYRLIQVSHTRLGVTRIIGLGPRIYVTLVCSLVYVPLLLLLTRWDYTRRIIRLYYLYAIRSFLATMLAYLLYVWLRRRTFKIFPNLLLDSAMPVLLFFTIYTSMASVFPLSVSEIDTLLPMSLAVHYFNTGAVAFANDRPLDFGKVLWDGHRLLGEGVSVRGTIGGLLVALLCSCAAVGYRPAPLLVGAFSGMLGDALGSFIKRRFALPSGSQVVVLDQLGAILPILILNTFSNSLHLNPRQLVVLALSTLSVPIFGNLYLFLTDRKCVPW